MTHAEYDALISATVPGVVRLAQLSRRKNYETLRLSAGHHHRFPNIYAHEGVQHSLKALQVILPVLKLWQDASLVVYGVVETERTRTL